MTCLTLDSTRPARADRRTAIAAIIWLTVAAMIPVAAVAVASLHPGGVAAPSGSPHVAPYILAKVGRPDTP